MWRWATMVSTDIGGIPILILNLDDVKTLVLTMEIPFTDKEISLFKRITKFLDDPACIDWEKTHG
jgi:hypothetical protein